MQLRPAYARLFAVALVLVVTAALPVAAEAAYPGRNGKVAFASYRTGSTQIYSVEPDGSNPVQLTDYPFGAGQPVWSPNGTQIAFSVQNRRPVNSQWDIYTMNGDGTAQILLTNYDQHDQDPSWSPDGTEIAFARWFDTQSRYDIFTMRSDGGAVEQITSGTGYDRDPAWSPDGKQIVFSRSEKGLFTMNPDGSNLTQLTHNPTDGSPDWSPDGTRIAFQRNVAYPNSPQNFDIYVINADGTGEQVLANNVGDDHSPAFSPDGTKIAFSSTGDWTDVWVMSSDGHDQSFFTGVPNIHDYGPDWQSLPNRAPDCAGISPAPSVLRPANRQFRNVELTGAVDPDGDAVLFTMDSVTQDEPVSGPNDRTAPDAKLTAGDNVISLRAERNPRGDGRVYRIAFTVSDAGGLTCSGEATVSVPRHPHKPTVDSRPPEYDSFG